ncbi:ECF transporter S component [Ruminococcaceae bacterium OttesenSCG-928-N02]|nr:ECF transporter S component [Ruminococcaceae bacterium OttesenSCG-928-N02]
MFVKKITVRQTVLGAVFLAFGLVFPFFTAQIPQIGSMLLPMHLPVLICGFVCGGPVGAVVGFITPLLRSVLFGMPPMFQAITMAFELCAYGLVSGLLYSTLRKTKVSVFISLIGAMAIGRVVWGCVRFVQTMAAGTEFTFAIFMASAFGSAAPGIILQLIVVPSVVFLLERSGYLKN